VTAPQDDIDRVMAIMAIAFDPAYGEAWTRRQVCDALTLGNCHHFLVSESGKTAEAGERACGFTLSRTGFEEEELLLFAVEPDSRGKGLGLTMLYALAGAARARGARRLLLEMRQGNPAEKLYRRFGFQPIGTRRAYYRQVDGTRIDAITFSVCL